MSVLDAPDAIGYVRSDVSGSRREWDEIQIRTVAGRLGYNLKKTIVFGANVYEPVQALQQIVRSQKIDAVVVPSLAHFEADAPPRELVQITDVITVSPEYTYARRSTGALPEEGEAGGR